MIDAAVGGCAAPLAPRGRCAGCGCAAAHIAPHEVTIVVLNGSAPARPSSASRALQGADLDGAAVIVVDNAPATALWTPSGLRFPDQRVLASAAQRSYAAATTPASPRPSRPREGGAAAQQRTRVAADFLLALPLDRQWSHTPPPPCRAPSSAWITAAARRRLAGSLLGHGIVYRRGANAPPARASTDPRLPMRRSAARMLITAEALRQVGPLDERYFAYHEEVNWCLRARRAGWRIYYEPLSCVFHAGSKSTAAVTGRCAGVASPAKSCPAPCR